MPRSVCIYYLGAYTEQLPAIQLSTANYYIILGNIRGAAADLFCFCFFFFFFFLNEIMLTYKKTEEIAINRDHALWTCLGQTDVVGHKTSPEFKDTTPE